MNQFFDIISTRLLCSLLISVVVSRYPHMQAAIIGGSNAPNYPFFVRIVTHYEPHHGSTCGGTIIAPNAVVSAAHCFFLSSSVEYPSGRWAFVEEIKVARGDFTNKNWRNDPNLQHWYAVAVVKILKEYEPRNPLSPNDITLVKVDGKFKIKPENILKLCPVTDNYETATVIGLGLKHQYPDTRANVLQEAKLFEDENCESWYGQVDPIKQVCYGVAGKAATCSGDSGGPLVAKDGSTVKCLVGIVSFGSVVKCDNPEISSGFTRAGYFADWINKILLSW